MASLDKSNGYEEIAPTTCASMSVIGTESDEGENHYDFAQKL